MRPSRSRPSAPGPVGWVDRIAYVLLAVFVLVTLGPALAGRGALVDLNVLTRVRPFQALDGTHTASTIVCRQDTVNYYLPGIAAIKRAFLVGDFPTWAPYEVGGAPLASLPNHAALSPLSLPYFLLPLWLAPGFVMLGEFALGIGGMFLFLRRLGVRRGPSVLAGVLFASSGFMMMWANWPHTKVAAFIPLLFWGLERTVQQRRARDVALVGVVVASMLLGGFPAVTLFALTLAGAYVLARVATRFRGRLRAGVGVLGRAGAGVILGVGLSAIQILPFFRNLGALGLEERQTSGAHLPAGLLLTSVVSDAVGLCVSGEQYGRTNPIESVGYLGAAAVVLAVCAVVMRLPRGAAPDRSPRVFLAVAGAFVVVVIWVGGPSLSALQTLPFYSANAIGRAQSVFCFVGAVLAGIGLDRLLRHVAPPPGRAEGDRTEGAGSLRSRVDAVSPGVLVLLATVGFAGWILVRALSDARRDGYVDHLVHVARVPALLVVAAVAAVLLTRFGPSRVRVVGPVVLALLAVGQSTAFAHTMLPLSDPSNLYPVTPTHAFLRDHIAGDRYAASGRTMYPATSDYYELRTPVGHEFTDERWRDLLLATDPGVEMSRTFSRFTLGMSVRNAARSRVLDQLSVRYWVAAPNQVLGTPDRERPRPDRTRRVSLSGGKHGTCQVPGGPLRGIRIVVARGRRVPETSAAVLHVAVRTPAGVRHGSQLLSPGLSRGPVRVATAAEDLRPGGRYPVEVWVSGAPGRTDLRGSGAGLECAAVRPSHERVRLVFSDAGANVYERLGALPRIRWATNSKVVADPGRRVGVLVKGIPDDTVLLDDHSTPQAEGASAQVSVRSDRPERMAVDVDAQGAGYLVVSDAIVRAGWTASVDGRRVALVHGNHALAAVPVPAGSHRVEISYSAPGLVEGAAVSAASGLVTLSLFVVPLVVGRRRRRSTSVDPAIP